MKLIEAYANYYSRLEALKARINRANLAALIAADKNLKVLAGPEGSR